MTEQDKYGEAIGIWNLTVGKANLDLRPKKGDNRKFRAILMNKQAQKDKTHMFDKFEDFMLELVQREDPPGDNEELRNKQEEYVEFNINELFEETLVKFRWTTREELEKSKQGMLKDLKKLTEGD